MVVRSILPINSTKEWLVTAVNWPDTLLPINFWIQSQLIWAIVGQYTDKKKTHFFTYFWVILSVYWSTIAHMSQMTHLSFCDVIFGKISKEMLILIHIHVTSIYLVKYFCNRQNTNHRFSPPRPLPTTLTTPPTHATPPNFEAYLWNDAL